MNFRKRLMMRGLIGSRAYNLHAPESDYDYRGVYLETPAQIYGLERANPTTDGEDENNAVYSLKHFVSLLCKGNPNIVEMIWLPDKLYTDMDPLFRDTIIANKSRFMSKQISKAYAGYALAQLKLVAKNGRPEHAVNGSEHGYDGKAADPA